MKRFFALVICVLMLVPMFVLNTQAAAEVQSGYDYYGMMYGRWDTLKVDGQIVGEDGHALEYLRTVEGLIECKAEEILVRGWMTCDVDIEAFGYQINGGEPVMSADYILECEQGVVDVATSLDLDYAVRYEIPVPVKDLKGENSLTFLIKLDGEIYTILVENSILEFDFIQEGTEVAPTATPEGQDPGTAIDPIYVRFNDYDVFDDFFLYSTNNNHVTSLLLDEEKNCAVFSAFGGEDPNVLFPFYQMALDGGLRLSREISCDEYKCAVIISRINPDEVFIDKSTPIEGTFYFTTDTNPTFDEMRNMKYSYDRTGEIQCIKIDFSKNRLWKGTLGDCRFDFFTTTDNDVEYELYAFALFPDTASANAFIENYKANGDAAIPTPEPTPTPNVTEPPAETEVPETEEPTEAPTEQPQETEKPADNEKAKDNKGCGGFAGTVSACALIIAAALMIKKKKD